MTQIWTDEIRERHMRKMRERTTRTIDDLAYSERKELRKSVVAALAVVVLLVSVLAGFRLYLTGSVL